MFPKDKHYLKYIRAVFLIFAHTYTLQAFTLRNFFKINETCIKLCFSGALSLLSIGVRIDVDDVAAITPNGHLVLNLVRESYQQLGIEGKPTVFERKDYSRYGKSSREPRQA